METSIHRQLKELYCGDKTQQEVWVDGFRIDAIAEGALIEIQQASLAALRSKLRTLLTAHDVVVVKPLEARKMIYKRERAAGEITSSRWSPRRETVWDVFAELVHFMQVFPHPRLTLEVLLVEVEEYRLPARARRRRRGKDYRVEDRRLVNVVSRLRLKTVADLRALLPEGLIDPFSTEDLARTARMPRWLAQKMAYCLRTAEAIKLVGKRGNALLYSATKRRRKAA